MRKYYVSSGQMQEVVLAHTKEQACIIALRRLDNPIKVSTTFRVSERGFDVHDDDFDIETGVILHLLILAQNSPI